MRALVAALGLVAAAGCTAGEAADEIGERQARAPVHVDSIFPIEEEVRRFAAAHGTAESLAGGAESLPELVRHFTAAANRGDADAIRTFVVTRAEFGSLHYPHTQFTRPPYEMTPALVWFQLENRSGRGIIRLLRWVEGAELETGAVRCDPFQPHGSGRLWTGCMVDVRQADGSVGPMRLFGPVLEHGGRFKLLSATNEL
jgi:hypothetical protein